MIEVRHLQRTVKEDIARIIDPTAFHLLDELEKPESADFPTYDSAKKLATQQADVALAKASAILELPSYIAQVKKTLEELYANRKS